MSLPAINGTNPKQIHDFYKQLRYNVQSLETLGKLADVKGNVRSTLDKLKKGGKSGLSTIYWKSWRNGVISTRLKKTRTEIYWKVMENKVHVQNFSMHKILITKHACKHACTARTTRTRAQTARKLSQQNIGRKSLPQRDSVWLFLRVEEHRMRHQNGILLTFISVIVTRQLGY